MRRYLYTMGGKPLPEPVEVDMGWRDPGRQSTGDLGKFEYDNARAPDGTDISSRTKHREYLKRTGLAMASDFTEHLAKANAERAASARGEVPERTVREISDQVGRAHYEAQSRRRR